MYMCDMWKINEVLVCDNDEFVKMANIGSTHLAVVCFHSFGGCTCSFVRSFYQSAQNAWTLWCDMRTIWAKCSAERGIAMQCNEERTEKQRTKKLYTIPRWKLVPFSFFSRSTCIRWNWAKIGAWLFFKFVMIFFSWNKNKTWKKIRYNLKLVCCENGQEHSIEEIPWTENEWTKVSARLIFSVSFALDFAT